MCWFIYKGKLVENYCQQQIYLVKFSVSCRQRMSEGLLNCVSSINLREYPVGKEALMNEISVSNAMYFNSLSI